MLRRGRARCAGLTLALGFAVTPIATEPASEALPSTQVIYSAHRSQGHGGWVAVRVVQTTDDLSQRMRRLPDLLMRTGGTSTLPTVTINDAVRYQRIRGFGAMLSDSSAWLIYASLTSSARWELLRELFGSTGLALNYLRLPMGASGFTVTGRAYSYDDLPKGRSDPHLRHFSITHDLHYIVPTLREALAINRHIYIVANPWSPPGWMKANHASDNFGNAGTLLSSDYHALASYFVKFIEAYRAQGIAIDAVTPQNEPEVAADPGLQFPESDEARFIGGYLGPAFAAARLATAIFGLDLSWNTSRYADSLATGPARRYLGGIAWHCYYGSPFAMSNFHSMAPALTQVVDECSTEIRPFPAPELLIAALRNWAGAVVLHNLALDPRGGPVEKPDTRCRGCNGVVTVDETTHRVRFKSRYYQLGQLSRFVHPGARRVETNTFVRDATDAVHYFFYATSGLDDVAFVDPGGERVLVTYNNSARPIRFAVNWHGYVMAYRQPAGAMTTFTWK